LPARQEEADEITHLMALMRTALGAPLNRVLSEMAQAFAALRSKLHSDENPAFRRAYASVDLAFHRVSKLGTRAHNAFAAQWLAYPIPFQRFADVLAGA
jgi:hypothetical protein